ncbi:MAG: hypothetical protein EWV91_17190 [Microcystis aeruginosa Ma_QC_Ca_00000000_S207]|uniref:Uncharacterized protein n=1 Tax=Microcystis aeruginosa Ma_QC_Ca_00000000_S207 TaxID=2486251 RepID=A0A552FBJ3_MICAE|nr:MAG: hypothetical protein EWV91_17190 [Microcystis aeruginosa Ma_QC_Ca_00000000_S207]
MLHLAIDYSIRSGERSPRYSSRWEGKMIRVIVLDDSEIVPEPSEKTEKTMFEAISLNTRRFTFERLAKICY